MREDPHRLLRFLKAQDSDDMYALALSEIRQGEKKCHWIWFVFPQLAGLGRSPMAREFAISGRAEAEAYLRHPILGPRLLECCQALIDLPGHSAVGIFGSIDAMKLRSSMTLFATIAPEECLFGAVLQRFFEGMPDELSEQLLRRERMP